MVTRVPLEEKKEPKRFQRGHAKRGGRAPGTPNSTTRILKEAIILAAEQTGLDGRGREGLTGYLKRIAVRHPEEYCSLLAKVLPLQLTGPGEGPIQVTYSRDEAEVFLQRRGITVEGVFDKPVQLFLPEPKANGHVHATNGHADDER